MFSEEWLIEMSVWEIIKRVDDVAAEWLYGSESTSD